METGAAMQAGDFTKSGYLADKSRGESIAESRHTIAVSQVLPGKIPVNIIEAPQIQTVTSAILLNFGSFCWNG